MSKTMFAPAAVQLAARLRGLVSGIVITPSTDIIAMTRRIMAC